MEVRHGYAHGVAMVLCYLVSSFCASESQKVSVIAAKKTTWFELFWIPIVPFSFKHIWVCPVCNWSHPKKDGCVTFFLPPIRIMIMEPCRQWEPAQANGVMGGVLHANAPPNIPGYQPSYIAPAMKQ
ncbi:hypothetical protein DL96DRAFT_1059623 [Flagelloscypha sp. PMI_526]|nr:hypothetical protein DL96DRAFT_1059623 [Flagelloscypha sp. PMI_526]